MSCSRREILVCLTSVALLLMLISFLAYQSAPQGEGLTWAMVNPLNFINGFAFLLSFGLGFPIWLSYLTVLLFVVGVVLLIRAIINRILKFFL